MKSIHIKNNNNNNHTKVNSYSQERFLAVKPGTAGLKMYLVLASHEQLRSQGTVKIK